MINHRVCYKSSTTVAGADPGGAPEVPPPLKLEKILSFRAFLRSAQFV
jgi:hypothetical protein